MRSEEEIIEQLKEFKEDIKKRENTLIYYLDKGYIEALEWVLEESEDDEE